MEFSYAIWIIILPALSFVFIGLAGDRLKSSIPGNIGSLSLFISLCLSIRCAWQYFPGSGLTESGYRTIIAFSQTWLRFSGDLSIEMGIFLDPISVMMLLVITLISFLVHVYSIEYMKAEEGYGRYFSFLSLFTFSMLGLVVAGNLFQMYMFWELVGVSSYLLIGHYYSRPSAVAAAKKAFIVTRFADLGFLAGILLLSSITGTFDFQSICQPSLPAYASATGAAFLGLSTVTWAFILIFIGGAGKSAMFPLHIWLPDAMEGPTPVSALIHAATMVVAGIYLVARLFSVFSTLAPEAMDVIAFAGGITALLSALIACTQEDIKRVLAYSTMSQLGYMMLALGVANPENHGFTASMFHLFTHAMFKALLFLGAGAVIHAVHSNLMKDMGGLRRSMPLTSITFLIACLAISGIPPFAGFFSKDEILSSIAHSGNAYYIIALITAGLTAYYMFRLYFRIFWNRAAEHGSAHDPSVFMAVPLLILAVLSSTTGFIPFGEFVSQDAMPFSPEFHWDVAAISTIIAIAGILLAANFHMKDKSREVKQGVIFKAISNKFYVDEVYLFITRKIIFGMVSRPIAWFDRNVVDGTMNGVAYVTNKVSSGIKGLQSGQLQDYLFAFFGGAVLIYLILIYLT